MQSVVNQYAFSTDGSGKLAEPCAALPGIFGLRSKVLNVFPLQTELVEGLPGNVEIAVDGETLHVANSEGVAPLAECLPPTVQVEVEVVWVGSLDFEPLFGELDRLGEADVFLGVAVLVWEPPRVGSEVVLGQTLPYDLEAVEWTRRTPIDVCRVVVGVEVSELSASNRKV